MDEYLCKSTMRSRDYNKNGGEMDVDVDDGGGDDGGDAEDDA
jgi:hypothetical protein